MKIEEEAWNAYPYTKTRYRCPFIERFILEVETCYQADFGTQENIFQLKPQEIEQRVVGESNMKPEKNFDSKNVFRISRHRSKSTVAGKQF